MQSIFICIGSRVLSEVASWHLSVGGEGLGRYGLMPWIWAMEGERLGMGVTEVRNLAFKPKVGRPGSLQLASELNAI